MVRHYHSDRRENVDLRNLEAACQDFINPPAMIPHENFEDQTCIQIEMNQRKRKGGELAC